EETEPLAVIRDDDRRVPTAAEPTGRRWRFTDLESALLTLRRRTHHHFGVSFVRRQLVGEPLTVVRQRREPDVLPEREIGGVELLERRGRDRRSRGPTRVGHGRSLGGKRRRDSCDGERARECPGGADHVQRHLWFLSRWKDDGR